MNWVKGLKGAKSFNLLQQLGLLPATTEAPHGTNEATNPAQQGLSGQPKLRGCHLEMLQKGCKDDENDDIFTDTTERHECMYEFGGRTKQRNISKIQRSKNSSFRAVVISCVSSLQGTCPLISDSSMRPRKYVLRCSLKALMPAVPSSVFSDDSEEAMLAKQFWNASPRSLGRRKNITTTPPTATYSVRHFWIIGAVPQKTSKLRLSKLM